MEKFSVNHDIHIHSQISGCSADPEQTKENILKYAERNGFDYICVTDHYLDASVILDSPDWYIEQSKHISEILPLPQSKCKFYFGCETELDKSFTVGTNDYDRFDFVIIPTTHLHMMGLTLTPEDDSIECRRRLYIERLKALMSYDLPFHKIGIAHLTCSLMAPKDIHDHAVLLNGITDNELGDCFTEIAKKGAGFEINFVYRKFEGEVLDAKLRVHRIAKECGCKFYLGSDSHHPRDFEGMKENFETIVNVLDLHESDKFNPLS